VGGQVAVAASNQLAAAAGLQLASLGGNAVDAALAAGLVAMVCEPGICSLAGGAFVTVQPADGSPSVTVDGNVEMPGRGLPADRFGRGVSDVTTGYGGGVTMTIGYGSVATPGALAAVAEAHRRYGRAPWREVVAPVVAAARDGFPLGSASVYYLSSVHESIFGWHPDSRAALHTADGQLLPVGALVRIPHLAESLSLIAEEGAGVLYAGELAKLIATDVAEHEGVLTAADLAAYQPIVRPALTVDMGGWTLATNPPPSIGGPALAAMLALMDGRPDGGWTAEDVAHLVAVQQAVLSYRMEHLDVAPDRTATAREMLDLVATGGLAAVRGSASTIHVSVVDDEGGACSVTASSGYGSGVMTPGTGIWLNSCLGEPELNRGGLHALPPGERLPSNMAPTVGRHRDGAVLAIGSPGADRITTALLQSLASFANGGLSLEAAIARPRLHVRFLDGAPLVDHEEDLELPPDLDLPAREHHALSMYFGGVGAALRSADGSLLAAADPRRAAVVAVGPT
jgi:gamma-glutamyltranspeptidase/glutathione hydrolase